MASGDLDDLSRARNERQQRAERLQERLAREDAEELHRRILLRVQLAALSTSPETTAASGNRTVQAITGIDQPDNDDADYFPPESPADCVKRFKDARGSMDCSTVRRWIKAGKLRCKKPTRRLWSLHREDARKLGYPL
jgi:hypothetical protein